MKISFISLGCPKNTVNSEQMLYLVQQAGHEIVPAPEQADAVVINTCAFIESATQEAINTIIEVGQLKTEGNLKYLIVAGCLAQRYQAEILEDGIVARMRNTGMTREEAYEDARLTIQAPGCSEHHTGLAVDFNEVN